MEDSKLKQFIHEFYQSMSYHLSSHEHKKITILGQGEGRIIMFVANAKQDVTPSDLSHMLNVGSSRIANALKDLEKKGYIIRKTSKEDKRQTIIQITPKGKKFDENAKLELKEKLTKMYELLGEKDAFELIRLLNKMSHFEKEEDKNV